MQVCSYATFLLNLKFKYYIIIFTFYVNNYINIVLKPFLLQSDLFLTQYITKKMHKWPPYLTWGFSYILKD